MIPGGPPPKRVAVLFTPVEETLRGTHEKMFEELNLAVSARQVLDALAAGGHAVQKFAFGKDPSVLAATLRGFHTDVVFNLSECPMDSAQKEPHGAAFL